jgi:hypothetical protein
MNLQRWVHYMVHGTRAKRAPRRKPRRGPVRLPHYRAWIRQQGCSVCGTTRWIDPAHIGPHGYSQKAADSNCAPLCRTHHDELHQIGRVNFERKYGISFSIIIESLFTEWLERRNRSKGELVYALVKDGNTELRNSIPEFDIASRKALEAAYDNVGHVVDVIDETSGEVLESFSIGDEAA